jgi:uncharacterized protein (DUF4415 family)
VTKNVKPTSAASARRRKPAESRTDWARVDALSDAEIARATQDDPAWRGVPADWFLDAKPVEPKRLVSVRLDADVLAFFRESGRGYQTRMNAVLRAYMQARKAAR